MRADTSPSLLLTAAAAVALAGCSGGGDDPSEAQPRPTAATGSADAVATAPAGLPADPVATVPSTLPGVTLEVYRLARHGDAVSLTMAVRNTGTEPRSVYGAFRDEVTATDLSGTSLFDPVGLKRYLVFQDAAGECLCSDVPVAELQPQQSYWVSAEFPAPPADVSTVAVETPSGSLPAVPLTRA
ncbi:hypothetical protein [Kineococcus auxinigenes]|uniref:hypothetical protein n=1 Tax=unclassified Kineococcus TaxID=2621656 RepID=UPI003D7C37FA